jgi:hypothetical protein
MMPRVDWDVSPVVPSRVFMRNLFRDPRPQKRDRDPFAISRHFGSGGGIVGGF